MGVDVLAKWKDVFSQSGIFTDAFIWVGWALTQGLKFFVDATQKLVDEMYKLIDFTSYAGIDKFFSTYNLRLILGILFAIALVVLGATYIFQGNEKRPKVLQNLLIAVMIITALPSMMSMLNSATLQWKDYILSSNQNISDSIIADNVVDLKYIDSQGFNQYEVKNSTVTSPSGKANNGFKKNNAKNIQYINATEKITKDDKKDLKSPDYFFNVLKTNSNGSMKVEELKPNKFFGFDMTEWYYRYHIDFLVIYIALIATGVAFVFMGYKVAKLIFDLAVHGFLAVIFSASDLTNGQRVKQVLQSIASIYITLALSVVMIKFFYLGQAFISTNVTNALIKAIALLFFAFAVIDGPNIIEKILGVDIGLKSGFQTIASTFMASKAITSATHSLGKLGSAAVGGAAGAVAGAKEGISNFQSQLHNNDSQNTSHLSGSPSEGAAGSGSGTSNLYGDNQKHSNAQQDHAGNNVNQNTDQKNAQHSGQYNTSNPFQEANTASAMAQAGTAAGVSDQMNEKNESKDTSNINNQSKQGEQSLSGNHSQSNQSHQGTENNNYRESENQNSNNFSQESGSTANENLENGNSLSSDNAGEMEASNLGADSNDSTNSPLEESENGNLETGNDLPSDVGLEEAGTNNLDADTNEPFDSPLEEMENDNLETDNTISSDVGFEDAGANNLETDSANEMSDSFADSGIDNLDAANDFGSDSLGENNLDADNMPGEQNNIANDNLTGESNNNDASSADFNKKDADNSNLAGDKSFGSFQENGTSYKEPSANSERQQNQEKNMSSDNLSGDSSKSHQTSPRATNEKNGTENLHTVSKPSSSSSKAKSQITNLNPNGIIGTGVQSYRTTKSIGGKIGTATGKLAKKAKDKKNKKGDKK